MSNVTDAIAAATAAAREVAAAPAVAVPTGTGMVPTGQGGGLAPRKFSMDDMSGAMVVDKWLKVKEFGILIGDSAELITKPMKVLFNATDGVGFSLKMAIKWGSPVQYKSSYDGVTTWGSGLTWAQQIAEVQQINPKSTPYRSADLPFTLLEDVVGQNGIIASKGTKVGNSLATTNWGEFETFWNQIKFKQFVNQQVVLDLGFAPKSGKGFRWGVLTFNNVRLATPEDLV